MRVLCLVLPRAASRVSPGPIGGGTASARATARGAYSVHAHDCVHITCRGDSRPTLYNSDMSLLNVVKS